MNSIKLMQENLVGRKVRDCSETSVAVITSVYSADRQNYAVASYYDGTLNVHVPVSYLRDHYVFL